MTLGKNGITDYKEVYNLRSSMDGTSPANGLALIEVLQAPNIIKQ
jgi:hypothetical protein